MDSRDQLTVACSTLQRRTGVRVPEREFYAAPSARVFADRVRELREYLRAFDGQLCRIEQLARAEAGEPTQLEIGG